MDVRADWTLERQLVQVEEHAVDQRVKEWIRQGIAHVARGRGGHRCGGAELVGLLKEARQRAADYDEWHVVRLLQDSIDYAEGRILKPVMEEQYRLFKDGLRYETKSPALTPGQRRRRRRLDPVRLNSAVDGLGVVARGRRGW